MIDFSGFMAAITQVETLFARERLEKVFEFIDNNGTGEIKISELVELLNIELQNEDTNEEDEEIADIMKDFDNDGIRPYRRVSLFNSSRKSKRLGGSRLFPTSRPTLVSDIS